MDADRVTYSSYLRVDDLLALQQEPRAHLAPFGVTDVADVLRGACQLALVTMLAETLLDYDEAVSHWRHCARP